MRFPMLPFAACAAFFARSLSALTPAAAVLPALLLCSPAAALEADPVQQHNSSALWFENWLGLSNATLVVSAPNGRLTEIYAASGTPVFELSRDTVQDGTYRYELKAATDQKEDIVNPLDNGRGGADTSRAKPFYMTGFFTVSRGVIVTPEILTED